jgi:pilus assembly protein CpaE
MDLPRLRDGKLYLKNLLAANYPKEKIRVIVNRSTNSKEISSSEVETILEFPVTTQVPSDDALVGSSVNLGQTFVSSSPTKPVSRAILGLAETVSPMVTGVKKRSGKWFSFMQ